MRISDRQLWTPLLILLSLAVASCESSQKKQVSAKPPLRAMAPTVTPTPAKAATPAKPAEKPVSPHDPVDILVDKVDKEYQAGQENYAAGHLEAAKKNFDNAVDLLLQGPDDVRSDDRLQREFDKIVEGVHTLEMQALKEGDGFSEQKAEPAPIDEANEVTFPVDPNIKAKAAAEVKETHSDLPLVINDAVASYIYFFSNGGRGTLEGALIRSGRYREMISRVLKEEGVPQDLIYLAQAESGFHPLALSRAGARGMWQFMSSRAAAYGLERNWWVDERLSPEKATRAAARHLKDLYNQFGDWYLAMAAYNSGPGTVQAAVQRTGYADFWELYKRGVLPRETKNYVPIILAVTIMAKNPEQYGLSHIELENPEPVDTVRIDYPVDLRLVAECVDANVGVLQELNPSLLRMTTPKDEDFQLHLPAGTRAKFLTAIASIPMDKRVWWRYYKVAPGDTLAAVAKKYRTTQYSIRQANGLDSGDLSSESKLIIPLASGKQVDDPKNMRFSRKVTRYRVRKGDTVLSVADDFGVPAGKLRSWNHLRGNELRHSRVLLIHRPLTSPEMATNGNSPRQRRHAGAQRKINHSNSLLSSDGQGTRHTVKPGETLSSIASEYNTTVAELQRNNKGLSSSIHPGDTLVVSSRR